MVQREVSPEIDKQCRCEEARSQAPEAAASSFFMSSRHLSRFWEC